MENIKAQKLPEGWMWEHFEDGSGGLQDPDGNTCICYDLTTSEIWDRWRNRWHFWENYPSPLNRSDAVEYGEALTMEMLGII